MKNRNHLTIGIQTIAIFIFIIGVTAQPLIEAQIADRNDPTHPPVAVIMLSVSGDPAFIQIDQNVILDASGSSDIDELNNENLNYSWDLDSFGNFDEDAFGMVITHQWIRADEYKITDGRFQIADIN